MVRSLSGVGASTVSKGLCAFPGYLPTRNCLVLCCHGGGQLSGELPALAGTASSGPEAGAREKRVYPGEYHKQGTRSVIAGELPPYLLGNHLLDVVILAGKRRGGATGCRGTRGSGPKHRKQGRGDCQGEGMSGRLPYARGHEASFQGPPSRAYWEIG